MKDNLSDIGEFAYEKKTGKVMTKCFSDPIDDAHKGSKYGTFEISLVDWEKKFQTVPVGYAPYWVNGDIEIRELPEFAEQNAKRRLQNEMAEKKKFLNDTDYVVSKINEAMIEDDEMASQLKVQYADVLAQRRSARARVNEIEGLLANEA